MKVTIELSHDSVAALADALAARLKGVPRAAETPVSEGFVSRSEAARIGIERKVLLRAERAGRLQAFRPGRVVMYRRRDVQALVESHPVCLVPEEAASVAREGLPTDGFESALQHAERRGHGG
ncbi:MAG: hypothetical protein ABSF69_28910 [Polyangiaceae bacterium]|jgi:hypothetical protein